MVHKNVEFTGASGYQNSNPDDETYGLIRNSSPGEINGFCRGVSVMRIIN